MTSFDVIIIGSGPAAVAALDAFDASEQIAVITGAAKFGGRMSQLHPKIHAVAIARCEAAGVAEPIITTNRHGKPLFSTALTGGLANYWGQQFVRFSATDPWPVHLFCDYDDYTRECMAIERLFALTGGEPMHVNTSSVWYRASAPRLLAGSTEHPEAGLEAMRKAFYRKAGLVEAVVFETRASSFCKVGDRWRVVLGDGRTILATKIILAAGVLGNANLISRSYQDIERVRFKDHSPWMLYVMGLGKVFERQGRRRPHFNAVTLDRLDDEKCVMFASVYDMRYSDLNLLLASTIGRAWPSLRNVPPPPGVSLINPVQIWTPATVDTIEIDASAGAASSTSGAVAEQTTDLALAEVTTFLKSLGGRVVKASRTQPGFGFHYHRLEAKPKGTHFQSIAELLRDRTGGAIMCADASTMFQIGCRPHTLTAMASARRIVTNARFGGLPAHLSAGR